jgi:DNA damage-binding protein 1
MANLGKFNYLFCGLGDGNLYSFIIEKGQLQGKQKFAFGTQQIRLFRFYSGNVTNIFATSDHAVVIREERGRLIVSNVNNQDLSHICPFNTELSPNALAYVNKSCLKIGTIENQQRLHIKSIPLGESPRRIVYHERLKMYGLLTTKTTLPEESSSFKILDGQSFEGNYLIQSFCRIGFIYT